jgi:hypothetical protein
MKITIKFTQKDKSKKNTKVDKVKEKTGEKTE